jgi:hypothetical protein
MLDSFATTKPTDSGAQLFIGKNTSERAKSVVANLLKQYPELPVIVDGGKPSLSDIKERAELALSKLDTTMFDINEDASIVFVAKDIILPSDMCMYAAMPTFNPQKLKFADNYNYVGRGKYFAIQARCAVLKNIQEINQ